MRTPAGHDADEPEDDARPEPPVTLPAGELPLPRGGAIGRYRILGQLGQGGIGRVVAAYDPQLERRVAIKLLRRDETADVASVGRERVLREARALARVVHPNIVAVYDAGFHVDELYVVMELVEGANLRVWLDQETRPTEKIVEVFRQAGRGLEAAHAAGIVHRDFKPDNVLVGGDGRVCVADFGLARVLEAASAEAHAGAVAGATEPLLTQTGALVGTPAYMSPEQHERGRLDARTDQFAFCVALFEALYGVRPFAGKTYAELAGNVRAGKLTDAPSRREAPSWMRAIVLRGLAADPDARYPSMTALLADLERDPIALRRRRLRALGLALGIAAAGGATALLVSSRGDGGARPCRTAPGEMAEVWNEPLKAQIAEAFSATGLPYAADSYRRVAATLDRYATGWTAMRTEACEATRVRGTQSDAALDLRMRCLDRRLQELRATADVLARDVDPETLARAATVAADLPPLAACADLDALSAVVPPPVDPVVRARVDAVSASVALARARLATRGAREGLTVAAQAVVEARRLGWMSLVSQALRARGRLEVAIGNLAGAEASMREALVAAAAARDDQELAEAECAYVDVVAHLRSRREEGWHMRPLVDATLDRAGASDDLRSRWLTTLGNVAILDNNTDDALAFYQESARLAERAWGPDHPAVAEKVAELCYTRRQRSEYAEAEALCRRALELFERHTGPLHPDAGTARMFLAIVLADRGKYDEAEDDYRRALGIAVGALDPDSDDVILTRAGLGNLLARRGRFAEARPLLEEALAQRERTRGPDDLSTMVVVGHLGRLALSEGQLDEADAWLARAERVLRTAAGPDHLRTAQMTGARGLVLLERGRAAEALPLLQTELAVAEKRVGPRHRDTAMARAEVGAALHGLGRDAEARVMLEPALAELERLLGTEHPGLAAPRLWLAEALWSDAGARGRARELARAALAAAVGTVKVRAERWIATHRD